MSIEQIQNQLVTDFTFLDNWEDRYQLLIDWGKELPQMPTEQKQEQYLIKGCQSQVWLFPEFKNGKIFFSADSDAIITKGIIAIFIRVFSGQTPQDILNSSTEFIDKIGLKEHLSPTRANGLVSMIQQIKLYAQAFSLMK